MKKQLDMVAEFMKAGRQSVRQSPEGRIPEQDLRYALLAEELEEYRQAAKEGDPLKVLDALVDLEYVLLGAVLSHGMGDVYEKAFEEVQNSNMTKLVNGQLVKREDGKVLKPPSYRAPNLSQFLKKTETSLA